MCPWGKCPGGTCSGEGGGVLSCHHTGSLFLHMEQSNIVSVRLRTKALAQQIIYRGRYISKLESQGISSIRVGNVVKNKKYCSRS